jgi:FkbM family methyltransferase
VSLGVPLQFTITGSNDPVEWRAFVRQQAVRFLDPLRDWTRDGQLTFFPESPGQYSVLVEWRAGDGSHGRLAAAFTVVAGRRFEPQTDLVPMRVDVDRRTQFWVPTAWEAQFFAATEAAIVSAVAARFHEGEVAWDIGANLGLYSVALARRAGSTGRLFCFEANPLCVFFLRLNLAVNGVSNAEIIPCALVDRAGDVAFTINYGNSNLGVGKPSPVYAMKPGHRVLVAGCAADDLVESEEIAPPALVKIDVEGGEGAVLRGMTRTLARHHPFLMIEIHGRAAAAEVCPLLDGLGYSFRRIAEPSLPLTSSDVLDKFPEVIVQLFCEPA